MGLLLQLQPSKFLIWLPIICAVLRVLFYITHLNMNLDFIDLMKISDLLNPETTSNNSSSNFPSETPPPHPNKPTIDFLLSEEDKNLKFRELADDLENRRNSVLERRRLLNIRSNSTTLADLNIRFRWDSPTIRQANLLKEVFGDRVSGNSVINSTRIEIVRNYRS